MKLEGRAADPYRWCVEQTCSPVLTPRQIAGIESGPLHLEVSIMTERRKTYRRKIERRKAKEGVTTRSGDKENVPKRIRWGMKTG